MKKKQENRKQRVQFNKYASLSKTKTVPLSPSHGKSAAKESSSQLGGQPVVTQHDPGEPRRSLMMLERSVRRHVMINNVVLRVHVVMRRRMMPVMVLVVRVGVVIVLRLVGLPLLRLLVLHPPILEPDLHLSLGEVEVARELPALLFADVRVEEELFL